MGTGIEWTDETWNPVTGCTKVSPGCAHCYAERLAPKVFAGQTTVDRVTLFTRKRKFEDVRCHEDRLDQPLRWRRPRKVFVNSMSDLFHEDVPDAFIDRVFAVMALAPQHTFQILTKRAERMRAYMTTPLRGHTSIPVEIGKLREWFHRPTNWTWPHSNVWLGVSVENQHFADERIPLLLQTPAAVRFISAEPLLAPVDLHRIQNPKDGFHASALQGQHDDNFYEFDRALDWVIVGGESGRGARPFDLAWARSIVQQCKDAGVPVFVKQVGASPVVVCPSCVGRGSDDPTADDYCGNCLGCHRQSVISIGHQKGGDPSEWPGDLRVREFPTGVASHPSSPAAADPHAADPGTLPQRV